jgi:transcription elongation factor GreB
MSRYRPPAPKSSPYITTEGFDALHQEVKQLWTKRAEVTRALSAAAAEGDRSENAEYIYRKKQLGEVDRRIRYLQKRIPDLKVVDRVADPSLVFFGAMVTLENEGDNLIKYRIVGADEIDSNPDKGYISLDSPLAKALLKKTVDDEVVVSIGEKTVTYIINGIEYDF